MKWWNFEHRLVERVSCVDGGWWTVPVTDAY